VTCCVVWSKTDGLRGVSSRGKGAAHRIPNVESSFDSFAHFKKKSPVDCSSDRDASPLKPCYSSARLTK
jgi:hypothetical protein